jgi:hypothetical protein
MARRPTSGSAAPASGEPNDQDLEFVLKALDDVYRTLCEGETAIDEGKIDEDDTAALCEAEFSLANGVFKQFLTEDVAQRMLPPEARELLGPIDRWRWCYYHVLCCIIFGWLVCGRFRTFRAFAYYLYYHWRCVREAVGNPLHNPLTADERHDFQTLIQALAGAYKPYLTDQLATVEFPLGVPDEILDGKIDCFEGEDAVATIFERLLTVDVAPPCSARTPLPSTAGTPGSGSAAAGACAPSASAAA